MIPRTPYRIQSLGKQGLEMQELSETNLRTEAEKAFQVPPTMARWAPTSSANSFTRTALLAFRKSDLPAPPERV